MSQPLLSRSTDELLTLLADRRRRAVVRHLSERPGPSSLDGLVETLSDEDDSVADERDLRTTLYHNHLPKLDEAGLVEYDTSTHAVRYRSDAGAESLLEFLAEEFDD